MRRIAKAVNFGILYGQSAFGLAKALGIPQADAAEFIAGYFRVFAGAAAFMDDVLDRPMGIVWQVMRACDLADDPSMLYDDESERVKFGYVAARNEAAKAAARADSEAPKEVP
jgi:hypothetical protein